MFQGLISGFAQARIRFNALEEVKDWKCNNSRKEGPKNKSRAEEDNRAGGELSGTAKAVPRPL